MNSAPSLGIAKLQKRSVRMEYIEGEESAGDGFSIFRGITSICLGSWGQSR